MGGVDFIDMQYNYTEQEFVQENRSDHNLLNSLIYNTCNYFLDIVPK